MKMRKRNRLLALAISLCMMFTVLPMGGTVLAAELPDAQGKQQTQGTLQSSVTEITPDTPGGGADKIEVPHGTAADAIPFPVLTANSGMLTLTGVTWACEAYDADAPGDYTFTAKLPEGYALADGAALPQITVVVESDAPSFVPYGMENESLYTIDAPADWNGLQAWLNSTAVNNAVVKINTAGAANQPITIPNKNITIESTVDSVENLRLVSNGAVTLTIKNLKFSAADANGAIELGTGSTLRFEGTNTLTVTNQYAPAIHVPENKSLTLAGVDASASLTVTASDQGAGIGGSGSGTGGGGAGGEVDITGGTVTVVAVYGAGIGGGYGATEGGNGGTVEISGASTKVNITQGWSSAGIGGGASNGTGGTGGSVNIKSGKVTISANHGAGIGGGFGSNQGGTGGTVEISGAATSVEITIADNGFGAGIGGGGSNTTGGAGGDVKTTGGRVTIKAAGNATTFGASIGGGGAHITGGAGGTVEISGGTVTAGAKHGAGIGGGFAGTTGGAGGTVKISGVSTQVNITATAWGAGIGGGGSNQTGGAGGGVSIKSGKVTINAVDGAGIGGGLGVSALGGDGGTVEISGAATQVNITVISQGAGIGGGGSNQTGGAGGDVRIENGKVTINAVDGAGIGGGMGVDALGGDGGTVEISGAATVVEITMAEDGYGAGIGGGGSNTTGGTGAGGTITDSTVTAYANWGADIGGGYGGTQRGAGGSLTIDSTGRNRAVLDLKKKGTNAALSHSIGTCQIKDNTGTLTGFYSRLTVISGTATYSHAQKDTWKPGIVKNGVTVSATANTPQQNQFFAGWTATPALTFADPNALTISFTMPKTAQEVAAQVTPTIITGSKPTPTPASASTPLTGDESNLWLWALLAAAALLSGGTLIAVSKRGNRKHRG